MPVFNLHQLHQRSVAVEFPVAKEMRVVRGRGRLVASTAAGSSALHVTVPGPAEAFEFIFDTQRFSGLIEHGERFACDYTIRLSADSNLPRASAA